MSKYILMVSVCTSKRDDTFILHPSLTTNLNPASGIVPQLTAYDFLMTATISFSYLEESGIHW